MHPVLNKASARLITGQAMDPPLVPMSEILSPRWDRAWGFWAPL